MRTLARVLPKALPQRADSGRRAGTTGDGFVPAPEGGVLVRYRELQRLGKVHRHQGSNVRGGIALASDEGHLPKPLVQVGEEVLHAQHAALDQRRNLLVVMRSRDSTALQPGNPVTHAFHHRREPLQLGAPLPHCDQPLVLGRAAQQGLFGEGLIEITHDGRHLADGGAVLEHQGRHHAARVDRPVGLRVLLTLAQIDCDCGNRESFFGEKYAHAPRIRRGGGAVQLQGFGGHGRKPRSWILRTMQPQSLEPPSTWTVWPVIQRASSEARKATTGAMSSGWATRFSACMASVTSRPASVLMKFDMSVSTTPGATALTRMPRGPRADAKCFTKVSTAPLVAA